MLLLVLELEVAAFHVLGGPNYVLVDGLVVLGLLKARDQVFK